MNAALALADEDGLAALSMRSVARRLGVEAMSLYRHVRSKDDLLDAVHDAVIARVPVAASGPWPDEVRRLATAFRDVLFAHPAVVPLVATRAAQTPRALAVLESGVSMLLRHGFDEVTAVAAFQTVFYFVVGHASFHLAQGGADDEWVGREFEEGLRILIAGMADGSGRG
ncbi:MAG: TetR/AcrR family transcriptional regulator C-terminal domain-containing protein [Myxococcales bacterium]|nr:TetR/AcrR family transcriptional regulator C-terminal domain-containing protein [Myxococcales bacterium]